MSGARIEVVECCCICLQAKIDGGSGWPTCANPECLCFGESSASASWRKRIVSDGPVTDEELLTLRRQAYMEGRAAAVGKPNVNNRGGYVGCSLAEHWMDGYEDAQHGYPVHYEWEAA